MLTAILKALSWLFPAQQHAPRLRRVPLTGGVVLVVPSGTVLPWE